MFRFSVRFSRPGKRFKSLLALRELRFVWKCTRTGSNSALIPSANKQNVTYKRKRLESVLCLERNSMERHFKISFLALVALTSRYCRTPSLKVGLHWIFFSSHNVDMHPVWAITLHAGQQSRGPFFCSLGRRRRQNRNYFLE